MQNMKKISRKRCLRRGIVYFLVYSLVLNTSLPAVLATPAGGAFTVGTGTIVTDGANTAVTVSQGQSVIEWGDPGFGGIDTSSAEGLTFLQAGGLSNSAVLNRIMSGNPTQFDGILNGLDMRIFIVNPAGIIFGEGSQINVSQLVASGLNMSNDAFDAILADESRLMVFREGEGTVQNLGAISADSVYLIGQKVLNLGSIVAPEGLVVLAAGDRVYLGQDGSNVLVEVGTEPVDSSADVVNEGTITADNGSIILAAGDRFSRAISNVGALAAAAGTITVDAARFENSGTIGADGGSVSLTASERMVLNGEGTITADGGSLLVETPELTIADGYVPAEAAENTLYEKWVEEQSQAGTDLELVAGSKTLGNIVVENISDGEITGGSGDIALRTKYDAGGITFLSPIEGDPVTTTIHTADGGSVYMLAGAGGIMTGDIMTDITSGGALTEPGQIRLYTNNNGYIETGQLTVNGGSYDEISVLASSDVTINGNVGASTNEFGEEMDHGTAKIHLVSVNGDVDIDGTVKARAYGKESTTAGILISAGKDVLVNTGASQIEAYAHTTEYYHPADASVSIYAGGLFHRDEGGFATVHVYAKSGTFCDVAEVFSTDPPGYWDETDGESHASLKIEEGSSGGVPDCPMPPDLPPPLPPITLPDMTTTHMGNPVSDNVLENDTLPGGGNLTAILTSEPEHGELIEFDWETGDYTYQPEEGFVGTDTFTYIATDGELYTDPITVTINVTNTLPVTEEDTATTDQGAAVIINVLANDSDPDHDPFTAALASGPAYGTLTPNPDGTFTYTPKLGYAGPDGFTYYATDGQTGAEFTQTTVSITVNPIKGLAFVLAAPLPEPVELEYSGCPALMTWAANELGINKKMMQIWFVNALASSREIQPCDTCARLKVAATVLQDADGTRTAALAQVINELASSTAPPSPEQMTSIASAIANNTDPGSRYAMAGQYLDALAAYVGTLNNDMNFSTEESITFAADRYVAPLADGRNASVAAFVAARLAALGG